MKRNNAGVPWPEPEPKPEPMKTYSKDLDPWAAESRVPKPKGYASKGMPPLKRVVEPGSALRTMKKKANPKPVAPKPTRFDNRKVSK